jgi:hypothetical protein
MMKNEKLPNSESLPRVTRTSSLSVNDTYRHRCIERDVSRQLFSLFSFGSDVLLGPINHIEEAEDE